MSVFYCEICGKHKYGTHHCSKRSLAAIDAANAAAEADDDPDNDKIRFEAARRPLSLRLRQGFAMLNGEPMD